MAKKSNNNNKQSSSLSMNKLSFYLLAVTAILYLVAMILSLCGVNLKIVSAMQGVASALMICVVAVLAWRYVAKKPAVWKVLYIVVLLVVIVGIILPLVL